ncbi:sensor histidine kinase [Sphingomonas mollis]|nr:GAF domain-containing protein [Sphingomonas sp. BT553]
MPSHADGAAKHIAVGAMGERTSEERRRAIDLLGVLDTPPEKAFDDIVLVASLCCDTPIALVSLLDVERQWFRARVGLDAPETPIDWSVCRIDIDRATFLSIPDLTADPRTRDNPLVMRHPHLRFYAGAPLVMRSGAVIGRLCVIDTIARPDGLSEQQQVLLEALARQVADHLELRQIARTSDHLARLQAALLDIGDRIRRSRSVGEMTQSIAQIVGHALQADRAGFGTVDAATETIEVEPDWTADGVASVAGRHGFEEFGRLREGLAKGEMLVIHDVTTDPRTAADPSRMLAVGIAALVNVPVRDRGRTIAVFLVHATTPRRWTSTELSFLHSVADRLEAGVSRHRLDQQQRSVNGEISHRLKNMLSMVQAIATQTLRDVPDRGPVAVFEQRLLALSTAHDALLKGEWIAADMAGIILGVLAPFGFEERMRRTGPVVTLDAGAAMSVSLVIHEMMTNACKYGALSNDAGQIDIDWTIAGESDDATLTMTWKEQGGPPVKEPTRRGFGAKLIRQGLIGTGGVTLRYHEAGLTAVFVVPLSALTQT